MSIRKLRPTIQPNSESLCCKPGDPAPCLGIVFGESHQHADASDAVARLLRARRERPCRSAAGKRDEVAPLHHSITSSARPRSASGKVSPSALAVFRLMTSSYFVGVCTG